MSVAARIDSVSTVFTDVNRHRRQPGRPCAFWSSERRHSEVGRVLDVGIRTKLAADPLLVRFLVRYSPRLGALPERPLRIPAIWRLTCIDACRERNQRLNQ